jgi:hypothetical protein
MKKSARIIVLLALVGCSFGRQVLPHAQHVHQYLTVEGYNLLRQQLGTDLPSLLSHLGGLEPFYAGDRAWQRNYLSTGAWREDEEDVVWWYGQLLPGAPWPFNTFRPYYSITHFWDADQGDAIDNYFRVYVWPVATDIGPFPNAYAKLQRYAYPNRNWIMKYYDGGAGHVSTFDLAGGGQITYTWYSYLGFEYNTLSDMYTTGRAWIVGYFDSQGQWIDHNVQPDILPRQVVLGSGWRDTFTWEILGRMCHLLQDQSVPAHTHRDEHGLDPDSYEDWVGGAGSPYSYWNHLNVGDMAYPQGTNPLHYLMYTTQQIANHFGSNGPYGGEGNNFVGGNALPEETQFLATVGLSSLGAPTGQSGPFDEPNMTNIRDKTLPQAIRATAGLLAWFASETGMINKVTVQNDFNAGQVSVNRSPYPSGVQLGYTSSTPITVLTSTPQTFGGYVRHFDQWQKLNQAGHLVASYGGISWSTTVNGNHTYKARFNREFNISITIPQYVESGGGGGYSVNYGSTVSSWQGQFVENASQSIHVEAVPPSSDWVFAGWSDGSSENPRSIAPPNNFTLYATFKVHLASSITEATGTNAQRKIISLPGNAQQSGSRFHAVYESGNRIFYMQSVDGATWDPEVLISGQFSDDGYSSPSVSYYRDAVENANPGKTEFKDEEDPVYYSLPIVAWQVMPNPNYPANLFARRQDRNGIWQEIEDVWYPPEGTPSVDHSSVIAYPFVFFLPNGKSGISYKYYTQGERWDIVADPVRVVEEGARPSAIARDGVVHLVWQDNNRVLYWRGTYNEANPVITWSTSGPTTLCKGNAYGMVYRNPHIAYIGIGIDDVAVVCEYEDGDLPGSQIMFHAIASNESSPFQFFGGNPSPGYFPQYNIQPSVASSPWAADHSTVVWHMNHGNIMRRQRKSDGYWSKTSQVGTGGQGAAPSYKFYGVPGEKQFAAFYTNTGNSPHALLPISNSMLNPLADREYAYRAGVLYNDSVTIGFHLGELALITSAETTIVGFKPQPDTVAVNSLADVEQLLKSEPFSVANESVIESYGMLLVKNGGYVQRHWPAAAHVRCKVELADVQSDQVLLTVADLQVRKAAAQTIKGKLRQTIRNLGNRMAYLRVRFTVSGNLGLRAQAWFESEQQPFSGGGGSQGPLAKAGVPEQGLPTVFALHQNYPNPFNPTTEIRFDLPDAGNVSLVVYDVLGREVANLATGFREAGYHSATWNASGQASGVYFARFVATDVSGNVRISKVNKLVLMK